MNFSLNMKYDITNNSAALTQKSRFLIYAGLAANERYIVLNFRVDASNSFGDTALRTYALEAS